MDTASIIMLSLLVVTLVGATVFFRYIFLADLRAEEARLKKANRDALKEHEDYLDSLSGYW
jgi:hypothetical protein